MATKYAKAAVKNWSDNTAWSATSSAGVDDTGAPTAADDVIFDTGATSAFTVDTTTCVAKSVTFQSASNAIVFTATKILNVYGNYTQFAGMSVTGTGILWMCADATLTSAGITFPGSLRTIGTTTTITFADNWTVAYSFVPYTSVGTVFNGNQLTINNSLSVNTPMSGTTNIILSGGTWSGTNTTGIANNLTIAGNVTVSGNVYYKTGTLTYASGTVTDTTGTLNITGSCTLDTSGMTWRSVNVSVATTTITLLSDLLVTKGGIGLLYFANFDITFVGNFNITCLKLAYYVSNGVSTYALTLVSGTTLTVTTTLQLGSMVGQSRFPQIVKSSVASSPAYLVYQGTQAECHLISGMIFTDIDASGSVRKIYNYQGGALTRTVNIENVVLPPATFQTVNGSSFIRSSRS